MTKEEFKAYVASKIKTNGSGDITAAVLADVLNKVAEIDVPQSEGILHVDLYDIIDVDDLSQKLSDAKIFGISVGGDGGARFIPVSANDSNWMFEYQNKWSITSQNIAAFDGASWDDFVNACADASSAILTEKGSGVLYVNENDTMEDGEIAERYPIIRLYAVRNGEREVRSTIYLNLDEDNQASLAIIHDTTGVYIGGADIDGDTGRKWKDICERMKKWMSPVETEETAERRRAVRVERTEYGMYNRDGSLTEEGYKKISNALAVYDDFWKEVCPRMALNSELAVLYGQWDWRDTIGDKQIKNIVALFGNPYYLPSGECNGGIWYVLLECTDDSAYLVRTEA